MKRLFTFLLLSLAVLSLSAQSGKIRITGKVTDKATGESLPGVSIIIEGTSKGEITNIEGSYSIMVSQEDQALSFHYLGYATEVVNIDRLRVINVGMETDVATFGEVVVTAQAKGQKGAIIEQVNSNTLKNVVAADRLQENPDANAAEAIGRLPGISLVRSGGEGTGLVVRGLAPRYTAVTLNGIEMPSTNGTNRGTNLSGISQYALQGAEVYKSLTADMDANSVGGAVNLKLKKTREGLHYNVMAQRGYNHMNSYLGNYKYLAEASNRFFDNKLGIIFTGSVERVNRSVQSMSGDIGPHADGETFVMNGFGLNDVKSITDRRSAMLTLDYQLTPGTNLMLYGMYNSSRNANERQSKGYSMANNGSVGYSYAQNPNAQTDMFQAALSGESNLRLLNIKAEYGFAYSNGKNYNLNGRSWNFQFELDSTAVWWSKEMTATMDQAEANELFYDNPDKLHDNFLVYLFSRDSEIDDENLNAYLDLSVPFSVGDFIQGKVKFGGKYRQKNRVRDDLVGKAAVPSNTNVMAPVLLSQELDWIVLNEDGHISSEGISEGNTSEFLNGYLDFGNRFNIDRLNEISDAWENISNAYFEQGPSVYLPVFGDKNKIGYAQELGVNGMLDNDQNITEVYKAAYLMSEINFGKYLMFLPGVRYETTQSTMQGFYVMPPQYAPSILDPVAGHDTTATRATQYLLPMIHLRFKPTKSFFIHGAYTQTLSRPDFNAISPNYYVNSGWLPLTYKAGNPQLKPELWTNLDLQFTLHNNKIGLLSATLFYKSVQDRIWGRSYKRIASDPIPDPSFLESSVIDMTIWENHNYEGFVKGIELDWQTSFHYLPKPFNYLTLSANYTFADSKTQIATYWMEDVIPPGGGRPTRVRVDSVVDSRIPLQPRHIANISLGFNKGGFNAWLSYQYNGQIFIEKNLNNLPQFDMVKKQFVRWDFQATQKFAIRKQEGFEVMLNIVNIGNFMDTQSRVGDSRFNHAEQYGLTGNLGLRFRF